MILVHNMFVEKTFNMSESVTSLEGALPLSSHFEMHLQKGSVFCISWRVSLQSSVRGRDVLMSLFDGDLTSVGGVVSVGVSIFLQV